MDRSLLFQLRVYHQMEQVQRKVVAVEQVAWLCFGDRGKVLQCHLPRGLQRLALHKLRQVGRRAYAHGAPEGPEADVLDFPALAELYEQLHEVAVNAMLGLREHVGIFYLAEVPWIADMVQEGLVGHEGTKALRG